MKFIFANSGGFGPPRQLQRALHRESGTENVLFSYYYLKQWDDTWVREYVKTGDPMQEST